MANPVTPDGEDTRKRYVVTSTWGQHQIVASDEAAAEEAAEEQLSEQGYADPANMILDGLTQEYEPAFHGEWEGADA